MDGINPNTTVSGPLSAIDNVHIFKFKLGEAMEFALIASRG
jgi:hypothetical protein